MEHWLKTKEKIEFESPGSGDWKIGEFGFEAVLKFVPPVHIDALRQCMAEFAVEFGLQTKSANAHSAEEIAYWSTKKEEGGNINASYRPDQKKSRVAIQLAAGQTQEEIKIQIPESEFEKIRHKITTTNPPGNLKSQRY